jgi:hypothetical protein
VTFWTCVEKVGWLEQISDGLSVPNFERWHDESAKTRLRARDRKRKQREREKLTAENSHACVTDVCDIAVTTVENRTEEKKLLNKKAESRTGARYNGKQAKPRTSAKPRKSAFLKKFAQINFQPADLQNPQAVDEMFQALTEGAVKNTDRDRLWVHSVAAHVSSAMSRGRKPIQNPIGLFVSIIKDDAREAITAAQEDIAQINIRQLDKTLDEPRNEAAQAVIDKLKNAFEI